MQIATILSCFSMGDELVRAAALLFTRAADLEENIDALTGAMQVGVPLCNPIMFFSCVYCFCVQPTCVHACVCVCMGVWVGVGVGVGVGVCLTTCVCNLHLSVRFLSLLP